MEVYTDGSCIGNISEGRYAGIGIWFSDSDCRNSSIPVVGENATNQYAELSAILYALKFCKNSPDLTIKTDSQYSINCVTKWYVAWESNSWKRPNGNKVLYVDQIQECLSILRLRDSKGYKTEIVHVKGHSGEEGNEGADKLAKIGAEVSRSMKSKKV